MVLREESLSRLEQHRRSSPTKDGEQTTHIQSSVDVFEDPNEIDVCEQEVTKQSEFNEKEMTS